MADNVSITAGTGVTIAADEVVDGSLGTAKVQYVKLMDGAIDGTAKVSIRSGGLITAPVRLETGAFQSLINVGTSAVGTLKAGIGGSTIYVTDLTISVGSASSVCLYDGGTTPLYGTVTLAANGGVVNNFSQALSCSSGSALVYKQTADIPLMIYVKGYQIAG